MRRSFTLRRMLLPAGVAYLLACASLAACAPVATHGAGPPTPPASLLQGTTLTGQHVSLQQDRGHPVVLIFWGAWCGPCHDEQPALNRSYSRWSPHGVVFLGVDIRDDPGAAASFVHQEHVPYPSVSDPDAMIAARFHVPAAPALAFIDARGGVADTILGGLGVMTTSDFDTEVRGLFPAGACAGC